MGKQEVWETGWAGWLASTLGAFPVARGKADREALMRCIATLQGGEPLVLFPEGERKDGLVVQPLFDGAAYVAAKAGVPIIPIGIGGSARVMPRHAKMIHPVKVCVVIGKPIYAEVGTSGRASRAAIADVTAQLSHDLQKAFDRAEARSRKLPIPS
jgi:1-acyl-sn-glycerol-3-phosphate acyltransferase